MISETHMQRTSGVLRGGGGGGGTPKKMYKQIKE